ncbi:MAG: carboxypeptidase regulatory-like domain-containing protein [Acidobacteria bacterium]|nr:carboxypeptidase regulatory-like domain-containing protein [Acidobacteriota bacterium]
MSKVVSCLIVGMFLCLTVARAQEAKPAAPVAAKAETKSNTTESPVSIYGSITGRVVSEDGPLPFVSITVLPVSNNNRNPGTSFRNVTTDAEGNFKVDGLRASAWQVLPSAQGYVVESTNDEAASPYFRIGEAATIRMVKGGVITGRVLNSVGEPLIAVPVSVQYVRDAQGRPASGGGTGGGFQTDDRGVYRIYGLQPGSYVVSAGRTGGGGGPGGGRLSPYEGDVPTYFPTATRDTAVEVSVSSGSETAGIDIQYRGNKGRAISGKITGATTDANARGFGSPGGGPGGISVTLTHAATGSMFNRTFVQSRNGTNTYALYGVPDGEYEVTAERNSPADNDAASAPRRVVVTGRDVTGIDLVLMPLASVQARLQLETENKEIKCETKRKAAFEEQLFVLQPEAESGSTQRQNIRRPIFDNHLGAPNRAGEMSFRNLNVGRYQLLTKLLDDNWYIRSITMPGAPVKATAKAPAKATTIDVARNGLNLRSGDKLTGVTVKVSEGAATVKGKVKAEENNSLPPMLRVYLVPIEKERADDVLRYAETGVSTDGAFSLGHLAPGKYWLTTRIEIDDAQKKIHDNAERAKLRREAEVANVVVELQACQQLTNYEVQLKK